MEGYKILEMKLSPLKRYLEKNSIFEDDIQRITNILNDISLISGLTYRQPIEKFQRITVNNWIKDVGRRVEFIKHLKNPPKENVKKYGRANLINQSVFYGTFDYLTALSEMRPEIGDTITVSFWKLKSEYSLRVTPIFRNSSKDGKIYNELSVKAQLLANKTLRQYDRNTRKQIEIILQFIADAFSKEVENSNHFDYFLSSYYANRLLYEFEEGEIDAILYPSVRQSLTLSNIALKAEVFERYFEIERVEESVIVSKPEIGRKGWHMEGTGWSDKFENDKIIW